MKTLKRITTILFVLLFFFANLQAEVFSVNSQSSFNSAQQNAATNDSIVWESGTYSDIFMDITKNNLFIVAEELGGTIFKGASRVDIEGDFVTLRGFQFVGGNIGTSDVVNIRGSNILITQINIRAYTSYKYLRIREESQYVDVTYCNFENRLNLDDQNILSILVDDNQPGYHRVRYCSFKNFDGTGNDLGIEPIRIGVSTQADFISRSVVEYCYFTNCDGDGELISSKATQNIYRYNTFENNSKAELVLRHGSEAIVYGNFFLNGKGGVRVREGQDHYIYNNYFQNLDDRPIYLQNEASDPLDNINIAFNTIVDCAEVRLGGSGGDRPTNVTFSNNIFTNPQDDLFEERTGTETWIGNISSGSLGITSPSSGLTGTNPQLTENSVGYFGLSENSPAINAAQAGYAPLPQFAGIDSIDVDMLFDLMKQDRPTSISEKDLGCSEFPHDILIQPIVTEENTGPDYDSSTLTALEGNPIPVNNLILISPNPVADQITITLNSDEAADVTIEIFDMKGKLIKTTVQDSILSGEKILVRQVGDLPTGIYTIRALSQSRQGKTIQTQTVKFVKL